jgi:hydroxymethylbilane synthase
MQPTTLRIATRKSPLAMWQAQSIATQLQQAWPGLEIQLLPMQTSGDTFLKDKLLAVGGKGLFVKELEDALLQNKADIAVHSMKDVPATLPDGLEIVAIARRDNPYDALVSLNYATLDALPFGAVVGTASLRRQSQLLAYRPDITTQTLRGNINTRLKKLITHSFDAIILAVAGLERMNLHSKIRQIIPSEVMLPSCGQGALGIECRITDEHTQAMIAPLHHRLTATCVTLERQINGLLGGNCHVPVAIYCQVEDDTRLLLRAKVLSADGRRIFQGISSGPIEDAKTLAELCTEQLFTQGAKLLLQSL